jgi:LuxR family transcriptional regulator, maltose regulon positive regulatory protein
MSLTREELSGLVRRPRLESRLDALVEPGTARSLMLVSAPPGFGKSTLVRSWAEDRGADLPIAHVDLREAGSGPRALWRLLVSALVRVVDPDLADDLRGLAVPDRLGHEDFLVDLLDVLADRSLVIAMDDVHTVRAPAVLVELDRLLSRVPPSLTVVLLSRTRPPLLSLHDLQLHGRLDHLGATDLAFTPEETAACCVGLTPDAQRLVWEHTEGWPAMVRLMELGVQVGASESDFWRGDDELAEHLFTELFSRQAPDVQRVLLMAAVAPDVPLDLVVHLSGRSDAGAALSGAGRRSGLVASSRRRDGTLVYHLHPILRAYLRGEHLRRDARSEQRAQTQAASWFRERGEALPAVRHALASGMPQVLEETLAGVGLRAVHEGSAEPLLEVLGSHLGRGGLGGWTTVVGAAALLDVGRTTDASVLLEQVGPGPRDAALLVARAAVAAQLRRRRGQQARTGATIRDELTTTVPVDVELAFAMHRGAELVRLGELDVAEGLLRRAVELAEGLRRDAALTDALISLAGVSSARADVGTLRERVARAGEVAVRTGWIGSTRAAYLHMLAGWSAHQALDDREALRLAQRASDLLDPEDDPSAVVAVHSLRAGCAEGASRADTTWLHDAWRDSDDRRLAPDLVAYAAVSDAAVSLEAGRLDRLREIVDGLVERLGACAETSLADAHLRQARGQVGRALAVLEPVLAGRTAPVYPLTMVNVHTFAARLELEDGNRYRAVEELRRALEVADALGCPRALLTAGAGGLELLAQGQGAWGVHEELVSGLLGYVTVPPVRATVALTGRELEVLRELPTLRTVEEIAGDMVISVNTLKTHLRSVYHKLGVSSRREAVREARRTGIL